MMDYLKKIFMAAVVVFMVVSVYFMVNVHKIIDKFELASLDEIVSSTSIINTTTFYISDITRCLYEIEAYDFQGADYYRSLVQLSSYVSAYDALLQLRSSYQNESFISLQRAIHEFHTLITNSNDRTSIFIKDNANEIIKLLSTIHLDILCQEDELLISNCDILIRLCKVGFRYTPS
jgi:hypothetical protein